MVHGLVIGFADLDDLINHLVMLGKTRECKTQIISKEQDKCKAFHSCFLKVEAQDRKFLDKRFQIHNPVYAFGLSLKSLWFDIFMVSSPEIRCMYKSHNSVDCSGCTIVIQGFEVPGTTPNPLLTPLHRLFPRAY